MDREASEARARVEPSRQADGAAPLLSAEGVAPPEGGSARWTRTADGVRIRIGVWGAPSDRALVLVATGRTEFVEKHYETVARLRAMGCAAAVVDWRGQGLSDRALSDRRKGHVGDFAEYQLDLDAVAAALTADFSETPWALMGHSMGGAIAARALMRRAAPNGDAGAWVRAPSIRACALSAPMLGLDRGPGAYGLGRAASETLTYWGLSGAYAAGFGPTALAEGPFEGNVLTSDPARFQKLAAIGRAHPELLIGGLTWGWLRAALREMHQLRATATPTLVAIGDADGVVSPARARAYAEAGPEHRFELLERCRHEPMFEVEAVQTLYWRAVEEHFAACGL